MAGKSIFDKLWERHVITGQEDQPQLMYCLLYTSGTVTVGERGEIHLPPRARNVFQIKAGDQLLLLGDENQGLALLDPNFFLETPKYFSEK